MRPARAGGRGGRLATVALADLAAALLLASLSGCSLTGSAVVGADDRVSLDVHLWMTVDSPTQTDGTSGTRNAACDSLQGAAPSLTIEPEGAARKILLHGTESYLVGCHGTGSAPLSQLGASLAVGHLGNEIVAYLPPGIPDESSVPFDVPAGQPSTLAVTFPGEVRTRSKDSTIVGRTVLFRDVGGGQAPARYAVGAAPTWLGPTPLPTAGSSPSPDAGRDTPSPGTGGESPWKGWLTPELLIAGAGGLAVGGVAAARASRLRRGSRRTGES